MKCRENEVKETAVSETKALTYALLPRLITIYLKLKFSNSSVPYHSLVLVLKYLISIRSASYGSIHFVVGHVT